MVKMLLNKTNVLMLIPIALFLVLTISSALFSVYLLYLAGYAHSIAITVLAITFLLLSLLSGFFNIFTAYSYYRSQLYSKYLNSIQGKLKPLTKFPTVAIVMPIYNEDPALVKKNMLRLKDMDYPKEKVNFYILDDSTKANVAAEIKGFAKANAIGYIHRQNKCGGMMEPIGTLYDKTGFVIMHRCTECGEERNVFGASNDNVELMTELSSTEQFMS